MQELTLSHKLERLVTDAKAAYAAGLCRPISGSFRGRGYDCCAVTAAMRQNGNPRRGYIDWVIETYGLTDDQAWNFVYGFDNSVPMRRNDPEMALAFNTGLAFARELGLAPSTD